MARIKFYHRLMAWMNRGVRIRVARAFPRGIARAFSGGVLRAFSGGVLRAFSGGVVRTFSRGAVRAFLRPITRAFSYGGARRGIYMAMAVIITAGLGWGFSLGYRRAYVAIQDARSQAREGQEAEVKSPAIPPLVASSPATASPESPPPVVSSSAAPSPAISSPAAPSLVAPSPATSPQVPTSGAGRVLPAEDDERPIAPVTGRVTCSFGWARHPVYGDWRFHPGLDIEVPKGTPVRASMSGRVVQAGDVAEYGLSVTIEHHGGRSTFYGHLDSIAVTAGEVVKQGAVIGKSGDTGAVKVPHVHYELRQSGEPVDPRQAIEFRNAD